MRPVAHRALTIGAILATTIGWAGCDAKQQTEYVAGISTQVVVPRDLKAVVISVNVGGVGQFCRAYRVYDGRVQLPRSLGAFAAGKSPSTDPITVSVIGVAEELNDSSSNPLFSACDTVAAKVNQNNVRILRRSRQPYVPEEILFLPMPLKFACFDTDCEGEDKTCKAGRCESSTTDEKLLPKYSPELVDGTGGACFPASECFAAAVPAVVVDPNDCTYALPNTPSAPPLAPGVPPNPISSTGEGLNVEITFDGGFNREIIDKDPVEGFFMPEADKPQRFRLGPGLCDMVKGVDPQGKPTAHRITAVRASGICQPKGIFQPLCADDQLAAMGTPGGVAPSGGANVSCSPAELKPAKSVLMVLADDTENHEIFYTGGEGSGTGSAEAAQSDLVSEALRDPSFSNTYFGLTFFPGGAGATCGPHPSSVTPALSATSHPAIVSEFAARKAPGSLKPKDAELSMSGALDDTYAALKSGFADANRRAVLVVGNRGFDKAICAGTPAARATAARTADKIDTYVAILARDQFIVPQPDPPPAVPGAQSVAEAGAKPGSSARAFDARKDKTQAAEVLRKIIDDLATCAYDVTADPGNDAVLTYSDPVAVPAAQQKPFYSIGHDAACTTDGAVGNGWGYNATSKRIYVCGKACEDYRSILRKAAAFSAQYRQRALAVPLFAHKVNCAPK